MTKYHKPIQVSLPQSSDLGFCTVNQISDFPFTIFNPNLKPINYIFKFTKFIIVPSKGVLMPNSISSFRIQFTPNEAAVIVGTVLLQAEFEEVRVFKFSAIGKYPYISVSESQVDLGEILVTKSLTKDILLKNNSEVTANFSVVALSKESPFKDNFFSFNPVRGVIPPKMNFVLKLIYEPSFYDQKNITKFGLICQNGNTNNIICKGYSKKFNVCFASNSINFGEIKLDSISSKVLTIMNNSQIETDFEFFTDSNNIFSFSQTKGTLSRNSYKKIIVEFRPRNTVSYYQRVYCIIRNHVLLYVDLIATCYDLLIKPIPLQQIHIDSFRKRVIEGRISEVQLKYIENNLLMKLSKRGETSQENSHIQQNFYSKTISNFSEDPNVLHKELFLEGSQNQLITISQDYIQFGYNEVMTISGQRELELTNRLNTKMTIFWISQKRENLNGEFMTVFNVFPESATLKPNVPVRFQITFRPLKSNQYYFQYLQFYAVKANPKISKRTVQDFQMKELKAKPETTLLRKIKMTQTIQSKVKEDIDTTELLPPISGVVRCVGNSFPPLSLPFLPIMKIHPSKTIYFKPCHRNNSVYDSVQFINQSDTPIYFKISPDLSRTFRAYPKMGLIEAKSFCVILVQFSPIDYKIYESSLSIYLNDMQSGVIKLNLVGACTPPQIILENEGKIFFPPTSIGVYTTKTMQIQNVTKNKVNYQINIPEKYKDEVYFEPLERVLEANQSFNLQAYFTPLAKRPYKVKIPINVIESLPDTDLSVGYYKPASGKYGQQQLTAETFSRLFFIELFGEGSDGIIQVSDEQLDFKVVKISEQKKMNFKLRNLSNCAFYIEVVLKNNNFDGKEPTDAQINSAFQLDLKEGVIPANSEIKLSITFSPIEVLNFNLKLLINARERVPTKNTTFTIRGIDPTVKCQIKINAQGSYPLLQIIDIRNDTLSVAALWQNFQIEKINGQLCCKLNDSEKEYLNIQNLSFKQAKDLQGRLKNYQWNLGYVSTKTKAKPRKVIMTVRNTGGTVLNYNFKLPSDNKIEQQLWADPGEPTLEQVYQKAIIDKKIFQIHPKFGELLPNEAKQIELLYSPCTIDQNKTTSSNQTHFLRVVFQISNGKSLVFNLKGTTLGPNQGLVTVKKTEYVLPQTPIGLLTPLRFPIEMNNVGSIKLTYKADIIYEDNEFPQVFKIQNQNHFILAGQNLYLYCLYKPIVQKLYNFKLNINIYDFSKLTQTLQLSIVGHPINIVKNHKSITKSIGQRNSVSQFGSKVYFSIQQIDFGVIQSNTTHYRMIILYNKSKDTGFSFDFPTQNAINNNLKLGLTCGDKFIIQPSNGVLEPESFIEIKLTLTSVKNPSIYQGEIPCNIIWASPRFNQNDLTQKDTSLAQPKETLFLRIKKCSSFNTNEIAKIKQRGFKNQTQGKSVVDIIFTNIINHTLNDKDLLDFIEEIGQQGETIIDFVDDEEPASISKLQTTNKDILTEQKKDFSKHENLFLADQFKEITQLIIQNTFFNIIQQTTHKQNDLLRLGKKFIQADRL